MRVGLVEQLRCPSDSSTLVIKQRQVDRMLTEGTLRCTTCEREFNIEGGIADLRLLTGDEMVVAAKRKEIAVRDSEAHEIYDRIVGEYRTRLETYYTIQCLGDVAGKRILDLGCGTGRITQALVRRGAQVIGVDYSLMSLQEALARIGGDGRGLDLMAADVAALPFAEGYFDLVVSSQVLEHLVAAEQRHSMFRSIARTLKPRGLALITTYNYDRGMQKKLGRNSRQGYSAAGVPFYCYQKGELAADLASYLDVKRLLCVEHNLPAGFPRRLKMPLGRWVDELVTRSPLAWGTGHLLMAICTRR